MCVCVCVCVGGGGVAILATFQLNFLNTLVLMCGCLDRQIDTFFNGGFHVTCTDNIIFFPHVY